MKIGRNNFQTSSFTSVGQSHTNFQSRQIQEDDHPYSGKYSFQQVKNNHNIIHAVSKKCNLKFNLHREKYLNIQKKYIQKVFNKSDFLAYKKSKEEISKHLLGYAKDLRNIKELVTAPMLTDSSKELYLNRNIIPSSLIKKKSIKIKMSKNYVIRNGIMKMGREDINNNLNDLTNLNSNNSMNPINLNESPSNNRDDNDNLSIVEEKVPILLSKNSNIFKTSARENSLVKKCFQHKYQKIIDSNLNRIREIRI